MARVLILDSGATHHMVGNIGDLINLRNLPGERAIEIADGSRRLSATMEGDIETEHIKVQGVYIVPGLKFSVVSVRQLAKCGIITTFRKHHAELWKDWEMVGGAFAVGELYHLHYFTGDTSSEPVARDALFFASNLEECGSGPVNSKFGHSIYSSLLSYKERMDSVLQDMWSVPSGEHAVNFEHDQSVKIGPVPASLIPVSLTRRGIAESLGIVSSKICGLFRLESMLCISSMIRASRLVAMLAAPTKLVMNLSMVCVRLTSPKFNLI